MGSDTFDQEIKWLWRVVSKVIGELADGLEIDLDKAPLKYQGLNGTEIAISESQERWL